MTNTMISPLPELSHLQFLVLSVLQYGTTSGDELRATLSSKGVEYSGPKFYQMMGRAVGQGLIESKKEQKQQKQSIRYNVYSITPHGRAMLQKSAEFYSSF